MMLGDIIENFPFVVPRDPASVIRRYIDAHDGEVETFEQKLDEVLDSHQINNAEGDELDQIGALFGKLGKRRGRSDQEYRIYLKTIVQAFNGRGTVPGIITAVAVGLGTTEDNVDITEDFENLEYDVIISDWPAHKSSTVGELAELADASVAQLRTIAYKTGSDTVGLDDIAVSRRRGVTEETSISDAVNNFVATEVTTDTIGTNDTPAVNQNKEVITDDAGFDDTPAVDQNQQTASDTAGADDAVASSQTTVAWDVGSWDSMNWAKNR